MDEQLIAILQDAVEKCDMRYEVDRVVRPLFIRALTEIRRLDALIPKDANTHGETYGRRSGGAKERLF